MQSPLAQHLTQTARGSLCEVLDNFDVSDQERADLKAATAALDRVCANWLPRAKFDERPFVEREAEREELWHEEHLEDWRAVR